MKSTGERLKGQEKAKRANLWDWIKSETERHRLLLHWWLQVLNHSHLQHIEMVCGKQDNNEGFCLGSSAMGCALKGLEKEITLAFQRYVILDAKGNKQAHLRKRLAFVKKATDPGHDSL